MAHSDRDYEFAAMHQDRAGMRLGLAGIARRPVREKAIRMGHRAGNGRFRRLVPVENRNRSLQSGAEISYQRCISQPAENLSLSEKICFLTTMAWQIQVV
jgi:hypothetical protein